MAAYPEIEKLDPELCTPGQLEQFMQEKTP
jgi:hypothetical protein